MNLRTPVFALSLLLPAFAVACGDDGEDPITPAATTPTTSQGGSSATGDGGGTTGSAGGMDGTGGAGGMNGVGGGGGEEPFACATIREQVLTAQDEVADGAITVLASEGDTDSVYIDGTAGGFQMASTSPWIYIDLDTLSRVDITDLDSFDATNWDLAIKRVKWRTNSGHSGAGDGGVVAVAKAFEDVTLADAQGATFDVDTWFDDSCDYPKDALESLVTALGEGWYEYAGMSLTINDDNVFIVRGADGSSFYKLAIESFYFDPQVFDVSAPATFNVDGQSANYGVRIEAL